jgi:hypothetical protein
VIAHTVRRLEADDGLDGAASIERMLREEVFKRKVLWLLSLHCLGFSLLAFGMWSDAIGRSTFIR